MKKSFKLNDLGCANCAAKMQDQISKLDGVNKVNVNFMMEKITIDAEDEKFNYVINEAKKIVSRIEPQCSIAI